MNIYELVAAGIIALYAMIGGAALNAAITAPKNYIVAYRKVALPLLKRLNQVGFIFAIAWPILGLMGAFPLSLGLYEMPAVWVAITHIALLFLLSIADRIAQAISEEEQ